MTTLKKEKRDFITFENILSLALAYTSIPNFSSDIMDWHRAVHEICQKYQESVPELRWIFFAHDRPPLPPMADQIYTLRTTLMMCGELEGFDAYSIHILRVPEKAKVKIRRREERRLNQYLEQIRGMAKIFNKHLKPKRI